MPCGSPTSNSPKSSRPSKRSSTTSRSAPIFHKTEERIGARIFVAFLAYCLQVTLEAKLRMLAGGTTPREVITKFKTLQMVHVHLPATDGRELTLSRYTQPEVEHRMLLDPLRLSLPSQASHL